jgi:hypothetical protein
MQSDVQGEIRRCSRAWRILTALALIARGVTAAETQCVSAADPPSATASPPQPFQLRPSPTPHSHRLTSSVEISAIFSRVTAIDGRPPVIYFAVWPGPDRRKLANTPHDPRNQISFALPTDKIFPTPAGPYRARITGIDVVECVPLDDPDLVKRWSGSSRSYFLPFHNSSYLFDHSIWPRKVTRPDHGGPLSAEVLLNPTPEELNGTKAVPEDRRVTVVEGGLIRLPTSTRFEQVPSVHRVLKIIPPDDSPTGVIGWVEIDSTPVAADTTR